jgi:hypothetical protein
VVAQRLKKYARDLRSLPNDVAAAWRSDGAAGVTLQLRRRSIDRLGGYVRYIVIEADMLPLQPHAPSDCEISCFTDADWSLLGDLVPLRLVAIFEDARRSGGSAWSRGTARRLRDTSGSRLGLRRDTRTSLWNCRRMPSTCGRYR